MATGGGRVRYEAASGLTKNLEFPLPNTALRWKLINGSLFTR